MKKTSSKYVCEECGAVSPQWLGKCPTCGKFGTLIEEIIEEVSTNKQVSQKKAVPQSLNEIKKENYKRISTGIKEFDNVLGGGIVPQSIVLIGGDPGVGKSTVLTEICGEVSKTQRVLYLSAEESSSQVKMRFDRLKVQGENIKILNECSLEQLESVIDDFDFIVVDSIQTVYTETLQGSAGSVGQVRECASKLMRIAKSKGKTVFIIGHVTKDGAIAGPKVLEHIMDCVLYFEGDGTDNLRIIRAVKNRFGSAEEVGVFEMTDEGVKEVKNYNGVFMSETRGVQAGSIVTPSMSGLRCMPVEIQALVSKTVFGLPRRMPLGIDYNKMVLMIAVLERKAYVPFYNQDVYMNAMGGIKLNEPSVDLAIALSLASASKNSPIQKTVTAFGEVGLTGEIRAVSHAEKRVSDSIKFGFETVIIPKRNYDSVKKYQDKINIVPVSHLYQAIKFLFGETTEKQAEKPQENTAKLETNDLPF